MSNDGENEGMPLARFVDLSARMVGLQTAQQCYAVAHAHGLTPGDWETANRAWTAKLNRAGQTSDLAKTHRQLLVAALRRVSGVQAPLGFESYIDINVLVQTGAPADEAFARHGHNIQSFSAASYEWMSRFEQDAWLEVYFQLRVGKAVAEQTGNAPRRVGTVYGPGNLVRGRKCHKCGGLKATKPTTAYVYCDYCATLFDYDPWIAVADGVGLDPSMVDSSLDRVTSKRLGEAFAAGDQAEYARITRWKSEVSTEVCPAAYSPRIRDPEYRKRFVDELIVPWSIATRFDPTTTAQAGKVRDAQTMADRRPRLDFILELLTESQKLWEIEGELLERTGVFAAHPDELERTHYLYVNASGFVRPWLAFLAAEEQQQFLAAAGVTCEYVAMPAVDFASRACGTCGAQWQIPIAAQRFMCEGCGFVLDLQRRTFPCSQCGGATCLPDGATEATCGYCDAHWTV